MDNRRGLRLTSQPKVWFCLMALLLVASACSSAATSAEGANSSTADSLFDPHATEADFDTNGGVQTGNTDAEVVETAEGASQLDERVQAAVRNWETNWDLATVDIGEIFSGGVPRDGIPPIDEPKFESAEDAANWLEPNEPGALVQLDGEARFYALSILTRHEIVNDRFGDVPVAVTFCPLCNTALAFDRRVDNEVRRFGVSGLLRNSDLVMWDDKTESMWQQITGEAIAGEAAGTRLETISTSIVSFKQFSESFPDGLSLAQDTGFGIDYGANPYPNYSSDEPFLFDGEVDPRLPALERVVGVTIEGVHRAYSFTDLTPETVVNDIVADQPIVVFRSGETADALDEREISRSKSIGSAIAYSSEIDDQVLTFERTGPDTIVDTETETTWNALGQAIEGPLTGSALVTVTHTNEFWFAWAAFFPQGELYEV